MEQDSKKAADEAESTDAEELSATAAGETETVDEAETVADAEPVEEAETVAEDKHDDEAKTVAEDKHDDEAKTVAEDKHDDEAKTVAEDKRDDEAKTVAEDKRDDEAKTVTDDDTGEETKSLIEEISAEKKPRKSTAAAIGGGTHIGGVTSGWDIRFAGDAAAANEAMHTDHLDAVICEFEADDSTWHAIMENARELHPTARRLVRCRTKEIDLPNSGANESVHRFVETANGMDALLDALTAGLGELKNAGGAVADTKTGAVALSDSACRALLQDVLVEVRAKEAPIVVFDLDSTLLDNGPRQAAILREYGEHVGIDEFMQSKAEHWVTWDVGDAMANGGLSAENVAVHREPFKAYWRERFFTSEYCAADEMIAGACHFVQAVRDAGGNVFYVTGRHEEMRAGSVTCLERLGFPVPNTGNVQLLMKPTLAEHDDIYKLRTYAALADHGTVVAAFDNEPTHINGYRQAFPEAFAIHLATDHSGREVKVAAGVISIRDFAAHGSA